MDCGRLCNSRVNLLNLPISSLIECAMVVKNPFCIYRGGGGLASCVAFKIWIDPFKLESSQKEIKVSEIISIYRDFHFWKTLVPA